MGGNLLAHLPYGGANAPALVIAAQTGDLDAFTALVRAAAPLAVAVALARTGRAELADEVAQEALVDAWRLLPTLREPRAFAAWLRKVVAKHADRHTRRRRRDVVPLDAVEAVAADADTEDGGAEGAIASREARHQVRYAIAGLPPHQRECVALFHLSGCSHADISALLGVPVSTVKKRLHDARRRLSLILEAPMSPTAHTDTAPHVLHVEAFLAARTGRTATLARALDRAPALVARTTRPEPGELASRYSPHANTLLAEAIAHGHVDTAELLLDRGADVHMATPGGSTPLMQAVIADHAPMVSLLARYGADLGAKNVNGVSALHIAVHRGHADVVDALVAAGADPATVDAGGRTPEAWRSWPGAMSPGAPGRVIDPSGRALDGGSALTVPERGSAPTRGGGGFRETGIKAVDLLAPLGTGGVHRLLAGANCGKIVLIGELGRSLGPTVIAALLDRAWDVRDFEPMLRELGTWTDAVVVMGAGEEDYRAVARAAVALAEARGGWVAADDRLEAELAALAPNVPAVTFGPHLLPDPLPARGAAMGEIVLTPVLAGRGDFPAVDAARSGSLFWRDDAHRAVADAVRAELAAGGERAARLAAWLTQPFRVAEAWNGRPGVVVPLDRTLREAVDLVAGTDQRDVAALRYLAS